MEIKKHGDPKKTRGAETWGKYYFSCEVCGCEFVEDAAMCDLRLIYSNYGEVFEMAACCECPNCLKKVTGQKI